jgi:uncharacterized membrane protein
VDFIWLAALLAFFAASGLIVRLVAALKEED